jgi:hypothetical protein
MKTTLAAVILCFSLASCVEVTMLFPQQTIVQEIEQEECKKKNKKRC